MNQIKKLIVIGSGNWGLTLACLFSENLPTRVWTIDADVAEAINARRNCPGEFFKYAVAETIAVEQKYSSGFNESETLFIVAVPSSQVRSVAEELSRHVSEPLVLSVSKGFDPVLQCTMSQLIQECVPSAKVVVLTGPTIANEVAEGKPTRAVLAGDNLIHLAMVKQALRNNVISFEISRNPSHHEICGALKGLLAIAVGVADGLNLGANIQGVLMTEGIREVGVVASFFGIPERLAYGMSGAGDLIATCISPDSRNRQLGRLLAEGLTVRNALRKVGMTVEGVAMSQTIETLWSLDVSIPLIHMVNGILLGTGKNIRAELEKVIASL
jgi:glycerol-3-phosphate dehydrogenase (NAD(P)+)